MISDAQYEHSMRMSRRRAKGANGAIGKNGGVFRYNRLYARDRERARRFPYNIHAREASILKEILFAQLGRDVSLFFLSVISATAYARLLTPC
jgi:hypothetical protein